MTTEGTTVDAVGTFFRALPDVFRAWWEFSDGFYGIAIAVVSGVLLIAFCIGALRLREEHGWLAALMGAMAATIAMWWGFGIIPSAWVYFADSSKELIAGQVVPEALPGATNFYNVFRDSVVIVETAIAVGILALLAYRIQKRFPQALAEGEEKGRASGGYK